MEKQQKLHITGMSSEMQGVGRLSDGRAVFVSGALQGEEVLAQITQEKPKFAKAQLLDVLQASPDRVEPDCPYADRCGGCRARHIRYDAALALKHQRVKDALERIGGQTDVKMRPIVPCVQDQQARNKAEYAVFADKTGRVHVGVYAAGSHEIIPVENCLLQSSESNAILSYMQRELGALLCRNMLRGIVTRVNTQNEMMLTFTGTSVLPADLIKFAEKCMREFAFLKSVYYCRLNFRPNHALDGQCSHICGEKLLREKLCGLEFVISPQSFFQTNAHQAEKLYACALEAIGLKEGCEAMGTTLDAYCGAGTMTLMAARFAPAIGVEIVAPAVENAKFNARANGLADRAKFVLGDAAKEIPKLMQTGVRFARAIVDPPRAGLDAGLISAMVKAQIPQIAYVSCDPATLARDVKLFSQGGYRLEWAQAFDMFPHTSHVETVVLLSRKQGQGAENGLK